jgi:hypothetical protein
MAAAVLSFGLMMTGCDSGGDSDSDSKTPAPPAATDMRTTYQGIGTVSTTDDTTFVLVLSKPAVSRAYTADTNDEYTLYVDDTPAEGSSFDYSTAPSQSGTVTAKNTDVFTLTPTGGDANDAFKATITAAGELSKIERGATAEAIVLSGGVSVDIPTAGFTLTKVEVPSLAGTVDFGDDPAYEVGTVLTVGTTGITAPSSSPAFSYRWLSKQTGDADFFDIATTSATDTSYTPEAADEGGIIRVIVTATGYNGFAEATSETIGPLNGPALVTLAPGSQGTAGDTKITGLTAGSKYLVKQGANWFAVQAGGTLASSKASPDLAAADSNLGALNGTEITGLTNGTTYDVYIYGAVATGKQIGATAGGNVDLGTGGKNAVADISALTNGQSASIAAGAGTGAASSGTTTVILLIDDVIIGGAVPTATTLADGQAPTSATLKYTTGTTTAGGATLQAKTGDKYITLAKVSTSTATTITATDRTVIGAVTIALGTAGADATASGFTLKIDSGIGNGTTIILSNVADDAGGITYTNTTGVEVGVNDAATAVKNACDGGTNPKYDISASTDTLTFTAKTAYLGVLSTPAVTGTSANNVTLSDWAAGTDAVAAVYTVTVDTALVADEKVTFTDVATGNVVYTPANGVTTNTAQATAIGSALATASGALYSQNTTTNVVTITADTAGVVTTPTATVAILP